MAGFKLRLWKKENYVAYTHMSIGEKDSKHSRQQLVLGCLEFQCKHL